MKISEHANYLLNEYGRLQFDYAAYCKPDGEPLRNEARNNLEEYIAELEAKKDILENQLREATNFLIDKKLHVDSLYEDGFKLQKRIAELEAENIRLGIEYQRMRLALGDIAINSKRALKESPTDQLTARWRQERQDDKSSNDTQTDTFVYGKESEE